MTARASEPRSIRSTDQLVSDLFARAESLWRAETGNPAAQSDIEALWNEVALVHTCQQATETLLAAQIGANHALVEQRDLAIHEAHAARLKWQRWALRCVLRDVAASMAAETGRDEAALLTALRYLTGEREDGYASMYAESDAAEALARLGAELAEDAPTLRTLP